jgi:hypothetical protein
MNGVTMDELYISYLDKKGNILAEGYGYQEIWEHSYNDMLKNDPDFKQFVNELPYADPLQPSEAFAGGRTEIFTLYKEVMGEEEIHYMDFVSLYPAVQMVASLPLYHPKIIFGHEIKQGTIDGIFGLVKLNILPPKDLFIPVLGVHMDSGKFVFPLCRTCSEKLQTHKCHHNENQRALQGTWVSSELNLALEYGYKIIHIYEIWHWSEEKRSTDVFKAYLRHFLKYKIEASGYPPGCNTFEQKCEYIKLLYDELGIEIKMEDVEYIAASRLLGKALINHLWGKLSQAPGKTHTLFIDQASELFDLLLSDKECVSDIQFVNDELLEVQYTTDTDFETVHSFSNVVMAAFITAEARIKLYKVICDLGERCYYVDTDSCIFMAPGPQPKNGLIGEMTDEILSTHGVRDCIGVFAGTGPKSYGYALKENKDIKVCKIKGITMSYRILNDLNIDSFKRLLSNDSEETIGITTNHSMRRNKQTKRIYSRNVMKSFRITNDKRVRIPGSFGTLPYGHQDVPEKT